MSIRNWPQSDRPREKLLAQGPHHLSDTELLAIFLRTGVPGKNALDLSRELLQQFGGLRAFCELSSESFCALPGLGFAKYTQLQAALEIARRCLKATIKREDALLNPETTRDYLKACLRNHPHEVFSCLFLDNANRVIQFEELFHGTIHYATIYPREVVKKALHHNAASVIFAHNHPSGLAEPSPADQEITQQLKAALALIEVRVIDHIIVGDGEMTSLAERGFL